MLFSRLGRRTRLTLAAGALALLTGGAVTGPATGAAAQEAVSGTAAAQIELAQYYPPPREWGPPPPPPRWGPPPPPPPRWGPPPPRWGGWGPPPPPRPRWGPPPGARGHIAWCSSRYRSYSIRRDAFIGGDGRWHRCFSPYD
ncbi:BA14K family protein [Consotaella salsifontis]|nr:BA14K family protein [Consotaella salsifontis]